jgi:hypothetical protein
LADVSRDRRYLIGSPVSDGAICQVIRFAPDLFLGLLANRSMSLRGYFHQPLPDLGSQRRVHVHSACHVAHSVGLDLSSRLVTAATSESDPAASPPRDALKLIREAVALLLLRHIGSQDFLFAEASSLGVTDPEGTFFRPVRTKLEAETAWGILAADLDSQAISKDEEISLEEARFQLNIGDTENPFPALFIWDCAATLSSDDFVPGGIVFGAHISDREVFLDLFVDTALMSKMAAEIFAAQTEAIISYLVSSPNASSTFPATIIPSPLRSALDCQYDPSRTQLPLNWLFEQASKRPSAIAHEIYSVMDEPAEFITYAELNKRSNAFARWLVAKGLSIEEKVAVCSDRDGDFYVAMAGALKAGACYVPVRFSSSARRRRG